MIWHFISFSNTSRFRYWVINGIISSEEAEINSTVHKSWYTCYSTPKHPDSQLIDIRNSDVCKCCFFVCCSLFRQPRRRRKHDTETNTQHIGIVNQNMMLMTIKQMSTISNTLSKHYELCTEPFDVRVNTYKINIIRFVLSHAKPFNTAHTHTQTEHHTTTRAREKRWS